MTRRLLIHCGLCATDAETLQWSLLSCREALGRNGVLYPVAGRFPGCASHDNIAFQVGRFAGFRAVAGDIRALFSEIAGHPGDVVISSTFFEFSLLYPERWAVLDQLARQEGLSVQIVVYSRPIADQLRASFNHIILSAFGNEFPQVARKVLGAGSIKLWDSHYCFSLPAIARAVARVPGFEVNFRHYESLVGGSVVSDFGALLGAGGQPLIAGGTAVAPEPSVLDLLRSFLLYRDVHLGAKSEQMSDLLALLFASRPVYPVVPRSLAQALAEKYGNNPTKPDEPPGAVGGDTERVNMARLYSAETLLTLRQLLRERPDGFKDGGFRNSEVTIVEKWRAWIADLD